MVTLNILLLTGFSRKGKNTFINMIFDKMVALENPNFLPVTSEVNQILLSTQPDANDCKRRYKSIRCSRTY